MFVGKELDQGLICNSGRWWNCSADFSPNKFLPSVVELSGTAFRLTGLTFSGPLPAIIGHRRLEASNDLN